MASFLRLALLILSSAQIFTVNSQNFFAYELHSIAGKFEKQFKILIGQNQQQQLQFEKFLKEQAEQTNRKLAEELANVHEIIFELTQQGQEKQQEIESMHEKLKAEQLISKNLNESLQNCTQNSAQLEEKFDQKTIEKDQQKSDQHLTKNLEQELLRSSNISAQLQICNQNSTKIIQELKIEMLKLEERLLPPCEFYLNHANTDQGNFKINLNESGLEPFDVNCQRNDEEAWLIIQRRQDGSEDFYRNWTDYKNGFGDLNGEFWLGLEKLHQLMKNHEWELKIWLRNGRGRESFARYKKFIVGCETELYKLTVGEFSGNVLDQMANLDGQKFSTPDRDNDEWNSGSCAIKYEGAWWFEGCGGVHLNGDFDGNDEPNHRGICWADFGKKLKYSQMAIRRLK